MKINNYEKSSFIYFCLSIYFCLLVIFIWWLINTKIYEYKKFNGIIINKEIVMILEERDLDYFYNNKHLFYNGNKYKFEITKITESLSFSDKKKIYELHLVSNLLKKIK